MLITIFFSLQTNFLKAPVSVAMSQGSKQDLILATLGSLLVWTDSYFILRALNRKRSAEWNCRIITTVHALLASGLCFTSAIITGPWPFTYLGEANTNLHNIAVVITLGYFLFDFSWCVVMRTEGPVMLAHHVVSIFALVYSLYHGKFGSEVTAVMGASEFTNPLLQLRWFMRHTGHYSGRKAFWVDLLFMLSFVGARLGAGSVYHYVCQTSPKIYLAAKVGGQAFYIISVVFGVQVLMFFYKNYLRKRRTM